MKKILLICIFITGVMNINAQTDDFICGTPEDFLSIPPGVLSGSTNPSVLENAEPIVLNVFYWGINRNDGTSDNKLTEADVLKAVARLNMKFNQFKIFFKYRGYDYIDSSRFYTVYSGGDPYDDGEDSSHLALISFARDNDYQYFEFNSINIYVPMHTVGFGGILSSYQSNVINANAFENDNSRVNEHEMGHSLGLKHTHYGWYINDPLVCEHVTRDPLDVDNYNALDRGDEIHDTAAVPDFRYELCEELGSPPPYYNDCTAQQFNYINSDCFYTNSLGKDCQDDFFIIFPSDVKNIMAYTTNECGIEFSTGQGIYMREWIDYHTSSYVYYLTTFETLYEPYKGEYYLEGPAEVSPPLFQPGFKYLFVECNGDFPSPSDYGVTFQYNINNVLATYEKDETNYPSIMHPNHSAIILRYNEDDYENLPQKCYNNWNSNPKDGSITKFNDDIFNTNITVTQQDSISINNENLIEELPSGLYKIEENYNDGSTQETIIVKQNN